MRQQRADPVSTLAFRDPCGKGRQLEYRFRWRRRGLRTADDRLQACVEALRLATAQNPRFDPRRYRKIVIFSDSLYVADNYTTALFTWSKNGWTKRDGAPVDNTPQWKDLVR